MADGSLMPGRGKTVIGFAGGGGSSVALMMATGHGPDVAMNHWMTAVLAHQRHFPLCDHYCSDIFEVDPRTVLPGEKIAFAWFSPDCTDFSKAKGKAPRSERIRGLIWSTVPWMVHRRPDVVMIENVEEFEQGGPIYRCPDDWRAHGVRGEIGEPIAALRGQMFQQWVKIIRRMGGIIEWRVLNAADYGAPTTRKRLYIIIRFDGQPIVWPTRTHAPRKTCVALGLRPWRGACEIIDWSQDCPSIFLNPDEVKDLRERTGKRVQRPLVAATEKRIARGIDRYVISSAEPFIVPITHAGDARAHDVREPLRTITSVKGGEFALVNAGLVGLGGRRAQSPPVGPRAPFPTITGKPDAALVTGTLVGLAHAEHGETAGSRTRDVRDPVQHVPAGGGDAALIAGSLVRTNFHSAAARNGIRDVEEPMATATGDGGIGLMGATLVPRYGEREGQLPRAADVEDPLHTIVPDANGARIAAAHLVRQFGTGGPADVVEPVQTIMPCGGEKGGGGKDQLVTAYMAQGNKGMDGREATDPVTTFTTRATQQQVVAASLDTYYSSGKVGGDGAEPLRVATGRARHSLVATWLEQANTGMVGHEAGVPVSTIVGLGSTQRLVEARLELDGGPIGRRDKVLAFLWSHFGLPTQDEWDAPAATLDARRKFGLVILGDQVWMIVDIGLRMLLPKELAAAMGLPAEYDLATDVNGNPVSKTHQTQMIGNMVSPPPAAAMIAANCPGLIQPERKEAA